MSETLYLLETRARKDYICPACQRRIPQGSLHFRHDPFPAARLHRGLRITHWCRDCILAANPGPRDWITHRIRIPIVRVIDRATEKQPELPADNAVELPLVMPVQVQLIGLGRILSEQMASDPLLIHKISSDEFVELICDRLSAMGFDVRRPGAINRKDGNIDVFFWPSNRAKFPFLGAAQVKYRRNANSKVGPQPVREFAGTIAGQPINAGLLVTNTSFTPDAQWFAREKAKLLRLRGFDDIRRWLLNNFGDDAEWREIPSSIQVCPGVVVKIR